jgi:hypothetical protein
MSRAIALRDTVPLDCFDDVLVEPFIPNSSVIALDIGILLRLARLDILERDVALFSPFQELTIDIFRAVVDSYALRLAAPLDDTVQASDHPLSRQ